MKTLICKTVRILGIVVSSTLVAAADPAALHKELDKVRREPLSPERQIREANLLYFIGARMPIEEKAKAEAVFVEGRELMAKLLKETPPRSGAIFWWGANAGGVARLNKDLAALKTVKEIEEAMRGLRDSDPDFGYAGADRVLGKLYQESPRFVSIGSSSRARESFERAIKRSPDFPGNRLSYALFLLQEDEKDEARKQALLVKNSPLFQKNDFGEFSVEKSEWDRMIEKVLSSTQKEAP